MPFRLRTNRFPQRFRGSDRENIDFDCIRKPQKLAESVRKQFLTSRVRKEELRTARYLLLGNSLVLRYPCVNLVGLMLSKIACLTDQETLISGKNEEIGANYPPSTAKRRSPDDLI